MRYESGNAIPDHPVMCAHPEAEGLLWIEGRAGPCLLSLWTCDSPNCPCRNVLLQLLEVSTEGAAVEEALDLQAWFDADTGVIVSPSDLPPPDHALLQEAAAALPAGTLRAALTDRDAANDTERNLAAADIPVEDVRPGVLQSWIQHATGGRDMASGGKATAGRLDHAGRTWFLDVLYCPNPECDCRKFHVVGMALELPGEKAHSGPPIIRDHFIVEGPFHSSRLEIFECDPGYRTTALAVVETWLARHPDKRAAFERQYADVRAIGERSLRQAGWSPRVIEAPRPKVGRNEACPCGSGKKFKQCCGRG